MVKARKVQRTGGSTFTVSLPKKWVEDKIDEGDTVLLEKAGSKIQILFDKGENSGKKVSLDASTENAVTKRRLVAAYLNGYDEIKISDPGDDEKLTEFIRNNLTGMEITKIEENSVTVRNIFKSDGFPLKNGLRRMTSTILTMMEDLIDDPRKVEEMDDILDRYYLLLLRQLVLVMKNPELKEDMGLESDLQIMDFRLVAKSLERIGDHLVKMGESGEIEEEIISQFIPIFEDISKALFSSDLSKIEAQIKDLEEIGELESSRNERIRRLMLDICETTVNFSIVESSVLKSLDFQES